jgi:hypothetical protein
VLARYFETGIKSGLRVYLSFTFAINKDFSGEEKRRSTAQQKALNRTNHLKTRA